MSLLPVAVYTLEVPCGEVLVPALSDFPATFRITMAAINPGATPQVVEGITNPRATLKIIRRPLELDDSDSDEDEDEYMQALMGSDSEEDESSDDEVNGGPSDPAKSKKARKAAAVKQLIESLKADEADSADEKEAANGDAAKLDKGKAKASKDDEDEEMEDDSEDDDDEDLELEEFVLCTLDPEKNYQQTLDITIGEKEEVFFAVVGTHNIYLTGNYLIAGDDGHNHHHEVYDSEDSDSEDGEDYDLSPDEDELDIDLEMDDDESDALDDVADPRLVEVDSDDEEAPKLVKAQDKKGKNKRSADELEEPATLDEIIAKEEPKLSKKQLKKLKKNNGEAVAAKSEEITTPAKADKKVQFAKNLEQGPTSSAEKPKIVSTPAPVKAKAAIGKKVVDGVEVDDKKIGTGPPAKKGNKVEMRYIGKLQNGKQFDANKKGKPFSFKLGSGEVIKGWDIGIAGMQVGGERRLTIPAKLGYGSKASGPIPANSTLIFDVKLLSIS